MCNIILNIFLRNLVTCLVYMLTGIGLRMKTSITDDRGIAVDHTASAEQCSLAAMCN